MTEKENAGEDWRRIATRRAKISLVASKTLWVVIICIGIAVTILNPYNLPFGRFIWVFTFLIIVIVYIYPYGLRYIPNKPPHVALLTFLGTRTHIVIGEGWHWIPQYFPFFVSGIRVNVEKKNLDFFYPDIRTIAKPEEAAKQGDEGKEEKPEAGGELSAKISFTYIPEDLNAYIDSGMEKGVENILRDMLEEDAREMGATYDWESFTFSRGELKNSLIKKISGRDMGFSDGEEKNREADKALQQNGISDIMGLGIRIFRLNVGKIKEQGELAAAAEARVRQQQRIRGEQVEMKHVAIQIDELVKRGVSAGEAADIVQTQSGDATKKVQTFRGLDTAAGAIGVGVAKFLEDSSSGQEKKTKQQKSGD